MWNKKCNLTSSSERDKGKPKALNKRIAGNKPPNIQKSMAVGTKKNALAQLSAMYPDSSGESSPELSDDNRDADDKLPTKTCNDERTEISGTTKETKDQCKHKDQSKQKLKEVEPPKNHGYSVGELLSKLRSEDAAKGNKSKKCKARTYAGVPPKEQGPCRELQFHQHDTQNTAKILDDTHLLNAKKNRCEKRNKGVYFEAEVALQKEWSLANHLKATAKVQDLIEDCETRRNGGEAMTAGGADHPRGMQDETLHENCTTFDDSKKTRLVIHMSDGLPLQHKHLMADGGRVTQLQCKRNKEVIMHTQGSWNGALETTIDSQFPSSTFPKPTEDTSELPVDYHVPEGKKAEVSGGDGADKSTEQNDAVLDSNIGFIALITECHSENVLHPISPEKPQSLCTPVEVDDFFLKQNSDREQKERSLYEASCDFKINPPCSPALDINKEGDVHVLVDVGMVDKKIIHVHVDENNGNSFDAMPNSHLHCETEKQSTTETKALVVETSAIDQSGPIISQEGKGHIQTGDAMNVSQGRVTRSIDKKHKDIHVPPEVSNTLDQDLAERSKDNHVPLEVCDTLNQDLAAFPSEEGDELNDQLEVHFATLSEPPSTENLDHSSGESCNSMRGKPILESADKSDDDCVTDIADADLGDSSVHVPSIGCVTVDEEVTGLVCQESEQSMDGSLIGLSNALDKEFSSNSPGPTLMKDHNMRSTSASNVITTETINTSSLSGAKGEEVTGLVCQESDQSMDESLLGLSNALDREFSSNSPSLTLTKDGNMRLRLASNVITTETIDTSSLSGAKVEEVTGLVCQESEQSMDGSLFGLSNALDREFSSNSPSPTPMRDRNMRLRSASNMITTETIDTSSLMNNCDNLEQESNKNPISLVDHDDSSVISRFASPFEGYNDSADKPINNDMQGVLTFIDREVWGEDFKRPSSQIHRESGEGPVADRSESVLTEFDALISHKTDHDLEEDTLKETYRELDQVSEQDLRALTTEQQEEDLSTSHLAEEMIDCDDVLSLVCDTEDLMSSLDDLLQDESLQLSKQSPTPDMKMTMSDNCTSTSTKDNSTTNPPKPSRLSFGETSPQRCRGSTRGEGRPRWDSKQGCKISIHTRNGNSRFVCKNQDSYRAVGERSPKRVPGPNRNWSTNKPLSASERLALHQRLGAQNAANTSPNLDLRQLIRNGPAIQQSGILQHQLQQHYQQQIQRHLRRQLPPALQLQLGLVTNIGQQPMQCTPDDVALILQRQQVMIEKIIQLYQKQRESDVVMEKQKQIIQHYQRAFFIAKKGGPLSMQEIHDEGNQRRCYSPRPRSPSLSADFDPERQIGRKWSLPPHPQDEQRYVEHQEAKRMKRFPGNLDVDKHSVDRYSGHPDVQQGHVEHRRNTDQSGHGGGCHIPQERQSGHDNLTNPRLQREERMVISVPSYHPEDERHQERRCILRRFTSIFSGTRNHPHRSNAGEVFQPIREGHEEQLRVCPGRAPFLKSDVPRQTSPVTVVEQYEGFRNPHMAQRGVPYQRPHIHPGQSCQQELASPVMACQGRRSPSPLHPNWESCRILERDTGTGRIIDYHHSSIHPQVRRVDMQQEHPPFIDPGRRGCSSPLYQRPPASRALSPDEEVSQALSRAPVSLDRLHSQDIFQAPLGHSRVNNQTLCRAPMRPPGANSQGTHRAPMRDPSEADSQGIHRAPMRLAVPDSQVIYGAPMRPSEADLLGIHRASMHPSEANNQVIHGAPLRPSVADSQGIHRAPMHPSEADSQGIHRTSMHPSVANNQVIHGAHLRPSVADSQDVHRAPMHPSEADSQGVHRASFRPSVVTISHHWTAQNFEGTPGALPRLQHPPCRGLRESQMRPHMEYQQYPGYPASNRVRQFYKDQGPGFDWDD